MHDEGFLLQAQPRNRRVAVRSCSVLMQEFSHPAHRRINAQYQRSKQLSAVSPLSRDVGQIYEFVQSLADHDRQLEADARDRRVAQPLLGVKFARYGHVGSLVRRMSNRCWTYDLDMILRSGKSVSAARVVVDPARN